MIDRDQDENRQLGFYLGLGFILGAGVGALAMAILRGQPFWVAIGAGIGLVIATALALGLDSDQV